MLPNGLNLCLEVTLFHLTDVSYKQKLLESSPLFSGRQIVHAMPWFSNKDYQSLIKHHCLVWMEVVNFHDYMRDELPSLAAYLGQVIYPPRPTRNRNRFCILWYTEKPMLHQFLWKLKEFNWGKNILS